MCNILHIIYMLYITQFIHSISSVLLEPLVIQCPGDLFKSTPIIPL